MQVNLLTTGEPALIDFTLPAMQAAARAYEKGWGATPVFTRGGGSIPIVADIYNLMKIPVVMMGYGLDTDGLHGTNEHYTHRDVPAGHRNGDRLSGGVRGNETDMMSNQPR